MKGAIKAVTPAFILSAYHFALAFLAGLLYQFPSREIAVVAVTGTKGKSSTLEYLNAIAEAAGMKTALASTIRFKIGDDSKPNLLRQTQPGRFFLQSFLAKAVHNGCTIAFIEMTSEGARQHRHRFVHLDALAFINLAPEHIESHGSLEAYQDAKFELGLQLARSKKRPRYMVSNADDAQGSRYLSLAVEHLVPFTLSAAEPFEAGEHGGYFTFSGRKIEVRLPGEFSLKNALAAATLMDALGFPIDAITRGIGSLTKIPGRAEEIQEGQAFPVIVDYAHTPDSLRALYGAYGERRKICVLGSTGGGRDLWKRPVMGEVADEFCDAIILTNEDPYDEDPQSIIEGIARGITKKTPEIIMDRQKAIRRAFELARASDVVLITGKGTDPTIQLARGTSIPWSDADVAREELRKLQGAR
jgi:UDP-N-acetylmuramoyl-L-alanyl-D-glutamate--2,6-diaminopimelate ligase